MRRLSIFTITCVMLSFTALQAQEMPIDSPFVTPWKAYLVAGIGTSTALHVALPIERVGAISPADFNASLLLSRPVWKKRINLRAEVSLLNRHHQTYYDINGPAPGGINSYTIHNVSNNDAWLTAGMSPEIMLGKSKKVGLAPGILYAKRLRMESFDQQLLDGGSYQYFVLNLDKRQLGWSLDFNFHLRKNQTLGLRYYQYFGKESNHYQVWKNGQATTVPGNIAPGGILLRYGICLNR